MNSFLVIAVLALLGGGITGYLMARGVFNERDMRHLFLGFFVGNCWVLLIIWITPYKLEFLT